MRRLLFTLLISGLTYTFALADTEESCKVTGNVLDENDEALSYATIQIISLPDSTISGIITDDKGYFCNNTMKEGNYQLEFSYVGFTSFKSNQFKIQNGELFEFNNIKLKTKNNHISEVIVTGKTIVSEIKPTNIKYKVEALISESGGSAGDVLKNMPSVFMGGSPGQNRDIRFRGLGNAYTKVLINGKETGLKGNNQETILDQIPAGSIESIEIMSVPGAEYSSEGINGIVNIVLKENKEYGTKGSTEILAGNYDGLSGGISLSHKTKKLNVFGQYDFQQRTLTKNKEELKTNYKDGAIDGYEVKNEKEIKSFNNQFLRTGFKYNFLPRTNFSTEYIYGYQLEDKSKNTIITKQNTDKSFKSAQNEIKPEIKPNEYHQVISTFNHSFLNNLVIKTNFSYLTSSQNKQDEKSVYNIDETGRLLDFQPKLENKNEIKTTEDYLWSISLSNINILGQQLQIGYAGKNEINNFKLSVDKYSYSDTLWNSQASGYDNFNLNYTNHALYISDEYNYAFLRLKAGLRYEYTQQIGNAEQGTNKSNGNYGIFLPSVSLTTNIDKTQYINFNFGRRIRRPGYKDLNPYMEEKEPGEFKQGNPDLMPEIAWAYEIGYFKKFEHFNFGTNIFYRDINDVIQKTISEDNDGNVTEMPENTGHANLYGIEFMSAINPFKFWEINASYSIFESEITSGEYKGDALKDQFKWSAKAISDFKLPYKTKMQISFNAVGPKISSEKEENTIWFSDLGIEKKLINNGSLIFRVSDVFDSLSKEKTEITDKSTKHGYETTAGRVFMIGFKYRF